MNQHKAMTQDEVDAFLATAWPLLQQAWKRKMRAPRPIPDLSEVADIGDLIQRLTNNVEGRWGAPEMRGIDRGLFGISVMADAPPRLAEWEAENGPTAVPEITEWIRGEAERAIVALTEIVER